MSISCLVFFDSCGGFLLRAEISNKIRRLRIKFCDWSRHAQESRGPLGPKSPESLKNSQKSSSQAFQPPCTGVPRPSGPEIPRKSQKLSKVVFPGLPARSVSKVSTKSPKTRKTVKHTSQSCPWGLFRDLFDTLGRKARVLNSRVRAVWVGNISLHDSVKAQDIMSHWPASRLSAPLPFFFKASMKSSLALLFSLHDLWSLL